MDIFIYIMTVCLDTMYLMVALFEDYWVGILFVVPNMGVCVSTRPIPCIFFEPTLAIRLVNFDCEELAHVDPLR